MKLILTALAVAAMAAQATASTVVLDDFSGGVIAANHPNPADGTPPFDAFGVYYDITTDTFGTPSDGGGVLQIADGGFTNGVYVIYESVVPEDGVYQLQADFTLDQTPTGVIDLYEIGAVVNGVHRGANPSDLAILDPSDPGTGLVSIDTEPGVALGPINVLTSTFEASAGDNILVAFSTNLTGPDFDANNTFWNGSLVEIDNLTLVLVPEPMSVATLAIAMVGFAGLNRRRK